MILRLHEVKVGLKIDLSRRGTFTPGLLKQQLRREEALFDFTGCCKIDTGHKLLLSQVYLNGFSSS